MTSYQTYAPNLFNDVLPASEKRAVYYIMHNDELVKVKRQEFEAVIFDIKYFGKGKKECLTKDTTNHSM